MMNTLRRQRRRRIRRQETLLFVIASMQCMMFITAISSPFSFAAISSYLSSSSSSSSSSSQRHDDHSRGTIGNGWINNNDDSRFDRQRRLAWYARYRKIVGNNGKTSNTDDGNKSANTNDKTATGDVDTTNTNSTAGTAAKAAGDNEKPSKNETKTNENDRKHNTSTSSPVVDPTQPPISSPAPTTSPPTSSPTTSKPTPNPTTSKQPTPSPTTTPNNQPSSAPHAEDAAQTTETTDPTTMVPSTLPSPTSTPTTNTIIANPYIYVRFSIMLSQENDITAWDVLAGKTPNLTDTIVKSTTSIICQDTDFIITTDSNAPERDVCYAFAPNRFQNTRHLMNDKTILLLELEEDAVKRCTDESSSVEEEELKWLKVGVEYKVLQIGRKYQQYWSTGHKSPVEVVNQVAELAVMQTIVDGTFIDSLREKYDSDSDDGDGSSIRAVSILGREEQVFRDALNQEDMNDMMYLNGQEEEYGSRNGGGAIMGPIRIAGVTLFVVSVLLLMLICCAAKRRMQQREWEVPVVANRNLKGLATEEGVSKMLQDGRMNTVTDGGSTTLCTDLESSGVMG